MAAGYAFGAILALEPERRNRICLRIGLGAVALFYARHGKILLQRAWGKADRTSGKSNTVDTQFRIGSMNKMFTSIAVLQLVQAGKLSLDASFGRYLPDYPNRSAASRVTIHRPRIIWLNILRFECLARIDGRFITDWHIFNVCQGLRGPERLTDSAVIELETDTGDYIGRGLTYDYTQATAIISVSAAPGHLSLTVTGDESWSADMVMPEGVPFNRVPTRISPATPSTMRRQVA